MLECVRTLRKEGWTNLDTYSPFPVHGAEDAMGLKVPLAWRLRIVYGADHSPRRVVDAAFEELLR